MLTRQKSVTKKSSASAPAKFHVKKGDTVMVIAGKDKGKTGTVKRVLSDKNQVLVDGLNMVKKAVKPNPMAGDRGGIVEKEAPLHLSKVMVYDLKSSQPTRIRRGTAQDTSGKTKRVRIAKKSGEQLDD